MYGQGCFNVYFIETSYLFIYFVSVNLFSNVYYSTFESSFVVTSFLLCIHTFIYMYTYWLNEAILRAKNLFSFNSSRLPV